MSEDDVIIGLTAIVVLGVGAQWLGRRVGFPSLLLLLPAGLLAGATGIVEPEEMFGDTLFPGVTLLVALLLFQSGLTLHAEDLPRSARRPAVALVTVGLAVTFGGAVGAVRLATDVSTQVAYVLGAILVVSGPTVVGPLLAMIRPRAPIGAVLNWEGSVLDPVGATLGIVVLNLVLAQGRGGVHPVLQMLGRLGLGVGVGVVAAGVLVLVLSQFLVTDDMEAAVGVLVAVLAFGVADAVLSEAGLFATITLGVVAANQRVVPTVRIAGFGETLEVFIIGTLFVLLGALVDLDDLGGEAGSIALIALLLVLVVRPLAAGLSLLGSATSARERAFIAWVDPRGVVAAATAAQFALTLGSAGFDASLMLPITFGVILGTGVVYGLTAPPVARALGVTAPRPTAVAFLGAAPWLVDLARCVHDLGGDAVLITEVPPDGDGRRDDVPMILLRAGDEELDAAIGSTSLASAVVAVELQPVVNLVVSELITRLGRRNVLVVPQHGDGTAVRLLEAWTPQPFAPGVGMDELTRRVAAGAAVTPCPDGLPDAAIPLVAVRPGAAVDLRPGMHSPAPDATVVALVGGAT